MTDEKQDVKGVEKPKTPQTPFGGWRNPASNPNDSSMADKGPQPVVSNSDGSQRPAEDDPFAIPGTAQPKQEPHIKSFSATFGSVIEDTAPPPAAEEDTSWDEPASSKDHSPPPASDSMASGGFSFAGGAAMFVENPDVMGATPPSSSQFITPDNTDNAAPQAVENTQEDDPFAWTPQQQPVETENTEADSPRHMEGESWMQASTSYEELQSSTRAALEEAKRAEQPEEPEQPEEAPNPYMAKEDEWVAPPMEIQDMAAASDKSTFEFDSPEVLPQQHDTPAETEEEQPASPFDLSLFGGEEHEEEIHAEPIADTDITPVTDAVGAFDENDVSDAEAPSFSTPVAITENEQNSPIVQEHAGDSHVLDSATPPPESITTETPVLAAKDTSTTTPPVLPDEELPTHPANMTEESEPPSDTHENVNPAFEQEQPALAPTEPLTAQQDSWQSFHAEQPPAEPQQELAASPEQSAPFAMPAAQDLPDYIPPAEQNSPPPAAMDDSATQPATAEPPLSIDERMPTYPATPVPMPDSEPDAPVSAVLPSSEEVVSAWDIAAADEAAPPQQEDTAPAQTFEDNTAATHFTAYTPHENPSAAEAPFTGPAHTQEQVQADWPPSAGNEAPSPHESTYDAPADGGFPDATAAEVPPAVTEHDTGGWENPPEEAMAVGAAAAATTSMQTHAPNDIQIIVQEHQQWLQSGGKDGRRANFRNANLQQFDFSNTHLAEASFRGANLYGATFAHCDLHGADLSEAQLGHAQFHSAHLAGAVFSRADLRGAIFEASDLQGADFSGAALSEAVMAGLNLGSAIFLDADLQATNLSQSSLIGANLRGANLTQANLTAANLSGANCRDVQFQHAILDNAVLEGANLKNTSLQNASLLGADLSSAGDGSVEQRQDTLQAEREQLLQEWNRLKEYEGQIQQLQASLQQREMTLQTERVNAERSRREFKAQQENFANAIEETRQILARHQIHDRRLKLYGVFWFMMTILVAVGMIMFISALDTSQLSWAEIGVVIGGGVAVLWLFIATTLRSIKTSNNLKRLLEIYAEQLSSPDLSGH